MREVKFRVWSKIHKQWIEHYALINCRGNTFAHWVEVDEQNKLITDHIKSIPTEDVVIQQYTNQTCDGVDIYEGDIVEAYWPDIFVGDEVKGTVVWNDHFNELLYPGWVIDTGKGLAAFPPWVKVLGNIFEGIKNEQTI